MNGNQYEAKREKLKALIKRYDDKHKNAGDPKSRKRLNQQLKAAKRNLQDFEQRWFGHQRSIDPKAGSNKPLPTHQKTQTQPATHLHHGGSSLNNANPFYEGLSLDERPIMDAQMAKFGIVGGDSSMNAIPLQADLHQGGVHRVERELGLEGKSYFKPGASFQEKLDAVEAFAKDQRTLQIIAEEAAFNSTQETEGLSRRVERTATAESAQQYHDKESRFRSTLTSDIRQHSPEVHAVAEAVGGQVSPNPDIGIVKNNPVRLVPTPKPSMLKGAMRLVLPSAGSAVVSIALGQDDLKARELAVEQDPSFINKAQLGLARAEMGADLAGAVPSPVTPTAETVGFVSGAANLVIDMTRFALDKQKDLTEGAAKSFTGASTGRY